MTGEVAYGEVAYGRPPRGRREDPVEFIETFVRNYPKGQWIIRERERLTNAIAVSRSCNPSRFSDLRLST
jgi:hypothetical protein